MERTEYTVPPTTHITTQQASTESHDTGGCNLISLRFRCYAMCQSPTGIDHAHEPVCDPSPVPTGGVCVPRCMSGYFPSSGGDPVSPRCVNGELFPATFQCLPYSTSGYSNINACPVTSLETSNANRVPCAGLGTSGLVVHGTRCEPQCKEGYETDVEELVCQSAIFNPGGFKCRRRCVRGGLSSAGCDAEFKTP